MNKLITVSTALVLLTLSYVGHSQTEPVITKNQYSLEKDYQQELDKWMLQAYEGDLEAQFKVGVLFTNDQFKSADLQQAVYWYKLAARQGHALAQYNLGHQYLTGQGVKRDENEAMKWWLKAAEQDHALAQFNVGRAYYLGIGLKEDHSQSRLWFERAANNNEPKSIEILEQLGWSKPGKYKKGAAPSSSFTISRSASQAEPQTTAPIQVASQPITQTAQRPTQNTRPNPIAVYTNPAKRSVLIAILDIRDQLNIVSATPQWTKVTSDGGFPVWVHQNYINASGGTGKIQGNAVNARSVPLVTNGTVVGQLNDNEAVTVIDQKDSWYRVVSPSRFHAWVKTGEFNQKQAPEPNNDQETQEEQVAQAPSSGPTVNANGDSSVEAPEVSSSTSSPINDNDWLFGQPSDSYTLQLASFNDPSKISEFKSRDNTFDNSALYNFTSISKDVTWTYFLYGAFESSDAAKQARVEIKQELAWIRSFGVLQQNRCVSWKQQIPTPKELNKYCS